MIRWFLLASALLAPVLGQVPAFTIFTINGRPTDPCAYPTINPNAPFPNVAELGCRPGQGQTVYLPRFGDPNFVSVNLAGNTLALPITGQFLQNPGTQLCLGRYDPLTGRSLLCSAGCDPLFGGGVLATPTATSGSFTPQTGPTLVLLSWNDVALLNEREARRVCIVNDPVSPAPRYAGFNIAVINQCNSDSTCGALITAGTEDPGKTTCCQNQGSLIGVFPGSPATQRVGVCINPLVQRCCGGASFNPAASRCCNPDNEIVEFFNTPCPCSRVSQGPNGCPASEPNCCLHSKFPEFVNIAIPAFGQCYDGIRHKCCNTGQRFDPGTFQCCTINGLQSINDPCPCQADQDCQSGIVGEAPLTLKCCKQIWPVPIESAFCNAYLNFPGLDPFSVRNGEIVNQAGIVGVNLDGTIILTNPLGPAGIPARINDLVARPDLGNAIGRGLKETQRCNGHCIDPTYQICCNGVACVREFEKCCNSTCCNRYVGTCAEGYREGTPNNRFNGVSLGTRYEQCSTIEQISILRAWWIFVLPTKLLALTLILLAFVIVFASRGTTRQHSLIERALIIVGVLVVIFALPNFFSPAYKYGIVLVLVGVVGILTAAERNRWLNILAIVVIIIGLFYLFDPFHGGNDVLSFSSFRYYDNSQRDDESSGLLHWIGNKNWRNISVVNSKDNFCVQYYDYFRLDPQLRDVRYENPLVTTFGYCGRGWITALLVFDAILCFFTILLLVLALIAFFLRFAVESFEPIELALEQHVVPAAVPYAAAPIPVY